MIKIIENEDEALAFAASFAGDRNFSEPMLATEEQFRCNLIRTVREPQRHRAIGVYAGGELTGLFTFLVLRDENYLEMLVGLSREQAAYNEMIAWLKENFPGCHCDFVYNPKNHLMQSLLEAHGAAFEPEQLKMNLGTPVFSASRHTVVPYSESYRAGYAAIHDDAERYWTAEKTIGAPDRFRIFLALDGDTVVGYIDVTCAFEENEPYDLFVREDCRCRGYGRALLERAIRENGASKMMLLVDKDNLPARHLYESVGFVTDELGGNITARLTV